MAYKKNFFAKNWLKYTDNTAYKFYKKELKRITHEARLKAVFTPSVLNDINRIIENAHKQGTLNAVHSGNAGDIIYALPTLRKIHKVTGAKINLYLRLDQPLILPEYQKHPMGTVMLNKKMVDMLFPLLRAQPYLNSCEIFEDQTIDINLDGFRINLFPTDKGNIARWCGYITGVTPDLITKWLQVTPDLSYKNTIVLARSERYRNLLLDYSFLSRYQDMVFIGVESEYEDMCRYIPDIKWLQVKDFRQLAEIIAGCKFFIGNQSFPFSIAEALKVPRILEISFEVINVVPEGANGHDFLFQNHFELLVEELNSENI